MPESEQQFDATSKVVVLKGTSANRLYGKRFLAVAVQNKTLRIPVEIPGNSASHESVLDSQ